MRNKVMTTAVIAVAIVMILGLLSACQGAPAPAPSPGSTAAPAPKPTAAPIVLKGIASFPRNHPDIAFAPLCVDKLNEAGNGEFVVNWIGGPEVIPAFDQGDALRKGVIDIIIATPPSYLQSMVPEVAANALQVYTAWEARTTGAYELWDEIYQKKMNAKFLARYNLFVQLHVYGNFKPEKIADFKGRPIRTSAAWIPWINAIGASPVNIAPTEIYTAMERKTVDGFVWLNRGITGWGLQEVTKYRYDPGVFNDAPVLLMNLDAWKKLPKHLQDAIVKVSKDMEYIGGAINIRDTEQDWEQVRKAGLTVVPLPQQEALQWIQIANDATWAAVLKDCPEYGSKLKEILTKTMPRYGAK